MPSARRRRQIRYSETGDGEDRLCKIHDEREIQMCMATENLRFGFGLYHKYEVLQINFKKKEFLPEFLKCGELRYSFGIILDQVLYPGFLNFVECLEFYPAAMKYG